MVADPVPSITGAQTGKDIEPGLKPVIEAVRNLNGLMHCMVRWPYAIIGKFAAGGREISVELDHGGVGINCVCAINLDFIVVLRPYCKRAGQDCERDQGEACHQPFTIQGLEIRQDDKKQKLQRSDLPKQYRNSSAA